MALPELRSIDSNDTGLAALKEASPGVLPGTEQWFRIDVDTYPQFGATVETAARDIISTSRQSERGSAIGITASGGVSQDLTQVALTEFWESVFASTKDSQPQHGGVFETSPTVTATGYDIGTPAAAAGYLANHLVYAEDYGITANVGLKLVTGTTLDEVEVSGLSVEGSPPSDAKLMVVGLQGASGDIEIDVASSRPAITSTVLDFTTFDINAGDMLYIGDRLSTGADNAFSFNTDENIGLVRVFSVAANRIDLDRAPTRDADGRFVDMVADTGTGKTIRLYFGDRTYNKRSDTTGFIKQSWRLERRLGIPNPIGSPGVVQAEYLIGAVLNETVINIARGLIKTEMRFVALDKEDRSGEAGAATELYTEGDTILSLPATEAYNSTSDVLANDFILVPAAASPDASPEKLFGFITDATFNMTNNASVRPAVGVFGGFLITLGKWGLGATYTAYFSSVSAPQAIRANSQVAITFGVAKVANGRRQGTVLDSPNGTGGGGELRVTPNNPIQMPITYGGARDTGLDYTMKVTEFNYLPS